MTVAALVLAAWAVSSVPVALLYGRAIRLAEQRAHRPTTSDRHPMAA